jgi:hypothetical protein
MDRGKDLQGAPTQTRLGHSHPELLEKAHFVTDPLAGGEPGRVNIAAKLLFEEFVSQWPKTGQDVFFTGRWRIEVQFTVEVEGVGVVAQVATEKQRDLGSIEPVDSI